MDSRRAVVICLSQSCKSTDRQLPSCSMPYVSGPQPMIHKHIPNQIKQKSKRYQFSQCEALCMSGWAQYAPRVTAVIVK